MFQSKIIFGFVLALSFIEFSTQQQRTENEKDSNRNDVIASNVKEETLAAVRRGDIRGFRRGMNKGGMKDYANIFQNYSYQMIKETEDAMNEKMFAIERLIASKLAVPASKEQPDQYHFNVTLLPGTDVITQLSLNLDALNKWEFYEKPLHTICSLPDVETRIVKLLIDKDLDVNEKSASPINDTPLDLAAYHGNFALVKFLIEKGADPKKTFRSDLEEWGDRNYYKFIKAFSPKDLDVPKGSKIHHNALVSAISGGNKEIIKYLINLGLDVNVDNQSWVALYAPIIRGQAEIVEILLKSGCDVNGRDIMGATALHLAADKGNLEIARLLINNGANVTAIDNFGWTPLHAAAFSSHNIALVDLLLEAGASIEVTTDRGFTPLILAESGTDPSFLNCLRPAIASNFSKKMSCQRKSKMCTHQDNIYIIAQLCNRGVNVEHRDDALGWSVLHWASAIGDENAARILVEKCRASILTISKAGMSPGDVAKYFHTNSN